MIPELTILTKLIIFGIVLIANAYWIIAFQRWTQFQVTEDDQHLGTDEASVNMIPKGSIIPESKMILWRLRVLCEKYVPVFWRKPIYACPTCMASLHGIVPFLFLEYSLVGFSIVSLAHWLFYTGVLSGVATYYSERA